MKSISNIKNIRGLIYGIAYGLFFRAIFAMETQWEILNTNGLMGISFLFIVPLVIGLLTAYYNESILKASKILALSMPLFSVIGVVLISVLFEWEGIICALMAIPIFALMALIGGFIGVKIFYRKPNKTTISFILLLPLLISPIESFLGLKEKIFTETTTIEINAPRETIWKNITRVNHISQEENRPSLFQFLGFPRPIEAVLDTISVGGVRVAKFDRGLFFTETITELESQKLLSFSIKADPKAIPPKALDEHVLVGGNYFDVLHGKYEIEQIDNNKYLIKLTSQFRLSTSFNFYSGFWSKLIMRDIQNNILQVLKVRAEKEKLLPTVAKNQ